MATLLDDRPAARLTGVDLARAVAVAGMMTIHVLPGEDAGGIAGLLYQAAHGRASGLFAVLAGVSLGLATRRAERSRTPARVAVAVRGLLVALLGLLLVDAGSRIAIVLPYYGVAFVVVLPFLWWPARRLAVLAGGWLVLGPLVSFALRGVYGLAAQHEQPTLGWLAHPGELLRTLALTGYYPVTGWAGYLLLGLAVAKLDLRAPRVAVQVLGAGAFTAAGSWLASAVLLGPLGGRAELALSPAAAALQGHHGSVPTDTAWWLAVAAPHSGTPFDLLHTAGTALAVLGAACLLPLAVTRFLRPVAAFGSMPLTVYTLHVLALAAWPEETPAVLALHVGVGVLLATAWRAGVGRGPLETAVGSAARAAAAPLRRAPVR